MQAGTDAGNAIGDIVEMMPTASWGNDTYTAATANHDTFGNHKDITGANTKTVLGITDGASTVNNVRVTAAVTGSGPTVSAEGTDTNVDLNLAAKGTGVVKLKSFNDGWVYTALPAYSSAVYNGNHSTDVTYASTVANLLTPGMRVRTSRTVAAPTQCTSLNGTTQYYNRAAPTNMAQTDDITCMAWIKLTSYNGAVNAIMGRHNGTTDGWLFQIDASGRVVLQGARAADDFVTSYQSVPLGRWVHVAASIDSSGTSGLIYIDGVLVPSAYTNNANAAFLAPTADFRIGAATGGTLFFNGKIAQAALFSAVISAATIRTYISQGLAGTETSLISAYSFNNSKNDLNANANNLTANGSAVETNADSPFALDANGTPGGTFDYGIVTKVATTVATIQTPEGCMIPTSGGVSTTDLSSQKSPFGMPIQKSRWSLRVLSKVQASQAAVSGTWYNLGSFQITVPVGSWNYGYQVDSQNNSTNTDASVFVSLSTSASAETDGELTSHSELTLSASNITSLAGGVTSRYKELDISAATIYYCISKAVTTNDTIYLRGDIVTCILFAECTYL